MTVGVCGTRARRMTGGRSWTLLVGDLSSLPLPSPLPLLPNLPLPSVQARAHWFQVERRRNATLRIMRPFHHSRYLEGGAVRPCSPWSTGGENRSMKGRERSVEGENDDAC